MTPERVLGLLRSVLDFVLAFLPVEVVRAELDEAMVRRAKTVKAAADVGKFGRAK